MEAMTRIAPPGGAPTTLPGEADNTLDSLARELARNKPRPRDEDERRRDVADEMPSSPPRQVPLPLALAALRRGEPGQDAAGTGGRDRTPVLDKSGRWHKPGAPGEAVAAKSRKVPTEASAMDKSHKVPALPLAGKALGMDAVPLTQGEGLEQAPAGEPAGAPVQAAAQLARRAGAARPAPAAPTLVRTEAGERKPHHESATPPLLVSQPAPHIAPRGRGEPAAVLQRHARHEPAPTQAVSEPPTLQSGLTYRFSSWGAEHAVTVQGQAGGSLLLQPSDPLVAQRLSEQWQSGNPQQWQLARDGGEGREQHRPQQDEEDEA